MLDLSRPSALTFDCYGTLIDWETGILRAVRAQALTPNITDDHILETYARLEQTAEAGPFRPYREVLHEVARGLADALGFPLRNPNFLADSVADWSAFPDTPAALATLASRYRLAILSNIDPDLLAHSLPKLTAAGARFSAVVTAADARSYKPAPGHFRLGLAALSLPAERVLHIAQSLYHDIAPARALGLSTVWVNRRAGRPGQGATYPASATPDLEVPDLATLAAMV